MTAVSSTIRHERPDDGKPDISSIVDEEIRLHKKRTGSLSSMNGTMNGTGRKRRGSREDIARELGDIRLEEGEYLEDDKDDEGRQPKPHQAKKAHSLIKDDVTPVDGHKHQQSAISNRGGNDLVEDINSCCTVS